MKVKFSLNTDLQELEFLTAGIESLHRELGGSKKQVLELTLILEELCTNIIMHGGGKGASKIEVGFAKAEGELELVIRDDGPPFDPTAAPQVDIHASLEDRKPGGLGIHLVQHFADSIEYRREDNYNIVIIRKKL